MNNLDFEFLLSTVQKISDSSDSINHVISVIFLVENEECPDFYLNINY